MNWFGSKAKQAEREQRINDLMKERALQRKLDEERAAAALAEQQELEKDALNRETEIKAEISALSSDNLNKITEIFDKNDKLLELKTKLSQISNDYNSIFRETVIRELIALVEENKAKLEASKLKAYKPEINLNF